MLDVLGIILLLDTEEYNSVCVFHLMIDSSKGKIMKKILSIFFIIISLSLNSVQAETIKTKTGNTYKGAIQLMNSEFVEIKTNDGIFKINKSEVENIDFQKLNNDTLENKEIQSSSENSFLPDKTNIEENNNSNNITNTQSKRVELEAKFNEINKKERTISEETKLFQVLKDGVVTIESDSGSGSGFIVDEAGLILTNHHVINDSLEFRVLFDEKTKVKAKLITASPEEDIAILLVNLESNPNARVLKLAKPTNDEPLAYVGEKVLAIGSPLNQNKIMTAGIVSKIKDDVIISDVNINHGNSGGPLFNSLGEVIGINTFSDFTNQGGPGISGIINITKAYPILESAKSKIINEKISLPECSLLPCFAEKPFPLDALKLSMSQKFKIKNYIYNAGPFNVVVYSPPLYYNKKNEITLELFKSKQKRQKKKRKDKEGNDIATNQDITINSDNPYLELKKWENNIGEFKPVLCIEIIPKLSLTGGSVAKLVLASFTTGLSGIPTYPGQMNYKFKDDFYNLKLLVNGEFVEPIKRGRILTQKVYSDYYNNIQDQTHSGLFMYLPELLLQKSENNTTNIELQIFKESDIINPISIILKETTLSQLIEDFKPYFDNTKQ